jgi:hypothetical protein
VVAAIVRRAAPGLVADAVPRGAQAGHGTFALSRLLVCSVCGTFLTGSTDKRYGTVRYQCHQSRTVPHPRSWVSESTVMPAVRREAQHVGELLSRRVSAGSRKDEATLAALDAKEARNRDLAVDGIIDKADAQRRLDEVAAERRPLNARRWLRRIERFPVMEATEDAEGRVEADPPGRVNDYLRRILERATVDMGTPARRGPSQPEPIVTFEWRDPSMRVSRAE